MTEVVFGVIGAVIGLGGLALTYTGHRHQRAQARELDARERRLREREQEAERREESLHASMLLVEIRKQPSSLDPAATLWRLTVTNGSAQPFTGVSLRYGDQSLSTPTLDGLLNPGASTAETLPVTDGAPEPGRCVVEFTDIAGRLWRRRVTGDLRRGRPGVDGQVVWDSNEPAFIHVSRGGIAAGTIYTSHARRRRSRTWPAWVALGIGVLLLVAVGYNVWHLFNPR
jgi:hypothetical protein